MQSASRLRLSTHTGMACVFLQDSGQLCLGSVVHFDPEPLGRWGGACHPRSHRGILTATEIRQKTGQNESRGVLCSRFGCCLHYGHDAALSTSRADPPSSPTSTLDPFGDSESSLPFFIKAGISMSGLPSAPWPSLPARAPCQALAGLGLISGGSAPAMETEGGCCSGARCRATVQPQGGGGKSFWIVPLPPHPCFCGGKAEVWIRKCTMPQLYLLLEQGTPWPTPFLTQLHMGLENTA